MSRTPAWLVPAALAALQLAAWPGIPLARRDPVSLTAIVVAVAVTVAVAVALLWRRPAPIATTAAVAAGLTVGALSLPGEALTAIAVADLVALYSVAVRRPSRPALAVTALVILWQAALTAATEGVDGGDYPATVALILVVYLSVAAVGRGRRRRLAERAAAAARLAAAEERRHRAADTERDRLARELHDVTAHHLTSIVVYASAAERLTASRPDLVAEALTFAARTGHETLAALRHLVAILQLPGDGPRLVELIDGFRQLGQQVTLELPADLRPPEAAAAIVREALTNTLRYAPGAAVRVRLAETASGVELTIEDDGAPESAEDRPGLGSGRGIAGMRDRAAAVGGTLDAGPRARGGWQVKALLPPSAAASGQPGRRSGRLLDAAVVAGALAVPAGGLFALLEDPGLPVPGQAALVALAAGAHAVPLGWRRFRPWTVLAAVAATGWLWPLLVAAGLLPGAAGWLLLTGLVADAVAVYAVARYGRRVALTWLAVPASAGSAALAAAVLMALDPPAGTDAPLPLVIAAFAALTVFPLALPAGGAWTVGFVARERRGRQAGREESAVAVATGYALAAAHAERARIAAGLREAVLRDTARVATAAEAGDLDGVLAAARSALEAMRGLLSGLREVPADRGPQPTVAAIGELCDRWRGHGREVSLEVAGAGRVLPADVDISAYRVAELLLAADTGPAAVRVDLTGDPLRIAVLPPPPDPDGEIAAGLRARVVAVGGRMATAADGTPEIQLPAGSHPRPEVDPQPDPDVEVS